MNMPEEREGASSSSSSTSAANELLPLGVPWLLLLSSSSAILVSKSGVRAGVLVLGMPPWGATKLARSPNWGKFSGEDAAALL